MTQIIEKKITDKIPSVRMRLDSSSFCWFWLSLSRRFSCICNDDYVVVISKSGTQDITITNTMNAGMLMSCIPILARAIFFPVCTFFTDSMR